MSSANWPFKRLIRSCRITAKHIPLPFHTPIDGSDATLSTEVIQPRQPEVRPNRSHRKVRFGPATRRVFSPPFTPRQLCESPPSATAPSSGASSHRRLAEPALGEWITTPPRSATAGKRFVAEGTRNPNSCSTQEERSMTMVGSWLIGLSAMDFLIRPAKRADGMINVLYEPVGQASLFIPRAYADGTYATNPGQQQLYLARLWILHDLSPFVRPLTDSSCSSERIVSNARLHSNLSTSPQPVTVRRRFTGNPGSKK